MPLHLDDFINIIAEICEIKELKVACSESLKGGMITGCAAFLGGLLLGPIGLVVGGTIGSGVSAISARNKFKSGALIIKEMSDFQKQKLYNHVLHAFRDFGVEDLTTLSLLLASQLPVRQLAVETIKNYLTKELSLQIIT